MSSGYLYIHRQWGGKDSLPQQVLELQKAS
jgi:hypothetical protein